MNNDMLSALEKDARLSARELGIMFSEDEKEVKRQIEECERTARYSGTAP